MGGILLQADDTQIATIKFEDGAGSAKNVTIPKEGGKLAADSTVVHNTGDETIAGIKTFSSSPIVPTATTSTQAVNKGQLDLKQNASNAVTTSSANALNSDALRISGSTLYLYKGDGSNESIALPASGLQDTAHSFTSNGYQKLSNGLIIQWGKVTPTSSSLVSGKSVSFPIAFPTACLNVTGSYYYTVVYYINGNAMFTVNSVSPTAFTFSGFDSTTGIYSAYWFAIGY